MALRSPPALPGGGVVWTKKSRLIALGLVLSVITLLVLTFAKLMLLRLQQQAGR